MKLWKGINRLAKSTPERAALNELTYRGLKDSILRCIRFLPGLKDKRVALIVGNRPLWAIYDIALTLKGATVVPVPWFFSNEQVRHIIRDANIDAAVVEPRWHAISRCPHDAFNGCEIIPADLSFETPMDSGALWVGADREIPGDRVVKIIYTSGTTGTPKGVMVTLGAIETVTASLVERSGASAFDRHLSLLPLSTLIEAIGGLYVPLSAGATVIYPEEENPRNVAAGITNLRNFFHNSGVTTLNLVPALLEEMVRVGALRGLPDTLRFVACGGAQLSSSLINRAGYLGIPLYQGYGLSECVTVVSLNASGCNRPGSAGLPLDHAKVSLAEDGEIVVSGGALMKGYLGGDGEEIRSWHTGDVGYMDDHGYLHVTGRKDALLSTSYGRSVSPEWVEEELASSGVVRQVMVCGNGRPFLSALVVPDERWLIETSRKLSIEGSRGALIKHPAVLKAASKELDGAMGSLPDYATAREFALIEEPFDTRRGLLTPGGCLNRENILKTYGEVIAGLYDNHTNKEGESVQAT
ncbi:MAG: AMP-binding protein [Thermodesulfobacteriota bacterium]